MVNVMVPAYVLLVLAGVTDRVAAFALTGAKNPVASANRKPMLAEHSKKQRDFIIVDFVIWPDGQRNVEKVRAGTLPTKRCVGVKVLHPVLWQQQLRSSRLFLRFYRRGLSESRRRCGSAAVRGLEYR